VRTVYWMWSMVMFVAIVVQIGFAGYGAFYAAHKLEDAGSTINDDTFGHGFGAHAAFGYLVILGGLIFVVIGLIAGVGKWRLGRQGVLALLLILQMFLAWFGFGAPPIGFFHPINAFLILALSGWIARDEWQRRRAVPIPAAAT
jgi:hypothetical protein